MIVLFFFSSGLMLSMALDPFQNWIALGTSLGYHVVWDMRFQLPICNWKHEGHGRRKYMYIFDFHYFFQHCSFHPFLPPPFSFFPLFSSSLSLLLLTPLSPFSSPSSSFSSLSSFPLPSSFSFHLFLLPPLLFSLCSSYPAAQCSS